MGINFRDSQLVQNITNAVDKFEPKTLWEGFKEHIPNSIGGTDETLRTIVLNGRELQVNVNDIPKVQQILNVNDLSKGLEAPQEIIQKLMGSGIFKLK